MCRYARMVPSISVSPARWRTVEDSSSPTPSAAPAASSQTTNHTPAWPLVLTIPRLLGWNSLLPSQVFAGLVGTATVVVTGFAGRAAGGARVGLIAAAIAAVYPNFWVYEHELMSETLALFLLATIALVVYRFRDHTNLPWSTGLGVLCGLLALTHPNYLLLIPFLSAPLIFGTPHAGRRRRLTWLAVTAVVSLACRRSVDRLQHQPVRPTRVHDHRVRPDPRRLELPGHLLRQPARIVERPLRVPDSEDRQRGSEGRRLARARAQRTTSRRTSAGSRSSSPREGRTWGLFRPLQQNHFDSQIGSPLWVERLRLVGYWLLVPFAVAGAIAFRRRRISLVVPLSLMALVAVTVAFSFGDTRYRAPAEIALVLLAAGGIAAIGPKETHAA